MMMSFLLWREEEDPVTSYSGCGVNRIFACIINNTSGQVVASVQVKA